MGTLSTLVIATLALSSLLPQAMAAHESRGSCPIGLARCFAPGGDSANDSEPAATPTVTLGMIALQVRKAMIGGPFAHKWVQFGTGDDAVTIGYGAADIPIIDAGQIVVTDNTSVDVVSKWHLFPWHVTPAERPGAGHLVGNPILVTQARATELITRQTRHRIVAPYIPLFNDCHTYVCAVTARAQGKSTLPCYLFFKGHF